MSKFTEENTNGFTNAQLDILNAALTIRLARGEDEQNASDAINDAWIDGATIDDLS